VAAGSLLVLEAGGLIGDLSGEGDYLHSGQVIAANPKVFVQMVRELSPFHPDLARERAARPPAA
jgi:myo-inositol-1(or 4)-monophosphatase